MDWPKFWEGLKAAPLWLFGGVGVVGWTLLYAPTWPGFDLSDVRKSMGGYIAAVAVGSTILFFAQATSRISGWATKRLLKKGGSPLVLTLQDQANNAWWGETAQADGSLVSNINVRFNLFNNSNGLIRLSSARIVKPRVRRDNVVQTIISVADPNGGRYFSAEHPVRPLAVAPASLAFYLKGRLAKPGRYLNAILEVTDHAGLKARLRVRLHPVPVTSERNAS